MTTTDTTTTATTAAILRRAAELLDEHGWIRQPQVNSKRYDLYDALWYAALDQHDRDATPAGLVAAHVAYGNAKTAVIDAVGTDLLSHWNSTEGRTLDDVKAALDKAAEQVDGQVTG